MGVFPGFSGGGIGQDFVRRGLRVVVVFIFVPGIPLCPEPDPSGTAQRVARLFFKRKIEIKLFNQDLRPIGPGWAIAPIIAGIGGWRICAGMGVRPAVQHAFGIIARFAKH